MPLFRTPPEWMSRLVMCRTDAACRLHMDTCSKDLHRTNVQAGKLAFQNVYKSNSIRSSKIHEQYRKGSGQTLGQVFASCRIMSKPSILACCDMGSPCTPAQFCAGNEQAWPRQGQSCPPLLTASTSGIPAQTDRGQELRAQFHTHQNSTLSQLPAAKIPSIRSHTLAQLPNTLMCI